MEKLAPQIAVSHPAEHAAVGRRVTMLALQQYADIPHVKVGRGSAARRSREVRLAAPATMRDFTGQHGKFWTRTHTMPWYIEEEAVQKATGHGKLGFPKVTQLKAAVAMNIRDYVGRGGFVRYVLGDRHVRHCLAAVGSTSRTRSTTATRPIQNAPRKLDYSRTLAFRARPEMDPFLYRYSDIDDAR